MHNKKNIFETNVREKFSTSDVIFLESNISAVLWIWATYVTSDISFTCIFWLFVFSHLSSFMFNRKMIHDFCKIFQIQYTLSDTFRYIAPCCHYKYIPANLFSLFFHVEPTMYLQYLMKIPLRHLAKIVSFHLWASAGFTTIERIWTVNFKACNIPVFMLTLLSQLLSWMGTAVHTGLVMRILSFLYIWNKVVRSFCLVTIQLPLYSSEYSKQKLQSSCQINHLAVQNVH